MLLLLPTRSSRQVSGKKADKTTFKGRRVGQRTSGVKDDDNGDDKPCFPTKAPPHPGDGSGYIPPDTPFSQTGKKLVRRGRALGGTFDQRRREIVADDPSTSRAEKQNSTGAKHESKRQIGLSATWMLFHNESKRPGGSNLFFSHPSSNPFRKHHVTIIPQNHPHLTPSPPTRLPLRIAVRLLRRPRACRLPAFAWPRCCCLCNLPSGGAGCGFAKRSQPADAPLAIGRARWKLPCCTCSMQ